MAIKYKIIPVTHFKQNCSLIWCDQTYKAAFIDPGGEADKLWQAIENKGVKLTKIILTHGHLDHVGAAGKLAKLANVPIIGPHKADAFWLDQLDKQASLFGFSSVDSFSPDSWLQHGDNVNVGQVNLQVLFCPGHTPGHVVFYAHEDNLVFVGDVLFHKSIGRTDFPRGDHKTLINSIHQHLLTLDDKVVFIPGHGPLSTIGFERQNNPFL